MGGIMSLTGQPDGEPVKTGVGIGDVITGMYAATGIPPALHHRRLAVVVDTVAADKTHRGHAVIEQVHADLRGCAY
jgi:crotonobetainyl-CoA:carnitine CoA-transferase CaiB-like acyl-CoA transferase